MKNDAEPPSCMRPALLLIGQDSRGNWVVQDQNGGRGGLFIDRVEALKFARSEAANHASSIVFVRGILELDMASRPVMAAFAPPAQSAASERRVA